MAATDSALVLHPDRLLPAEPGERAIARRLYEAVRDLPVISPHGHVDPRLLLDDEPFPDPATLFDHARPLRDAAAARRRRRARRARRRPGAAVRGRVAAGVAAAVRALARLPRHAGPVLARGGAGRDLRRDRPARRPRRPTRSTTRSPSASPRTPTGRARCTSGSASRCSPPPTIRADDLAAHAALAADPSWSGRVIPTFRPDRYLEPAQPGWAEAVARLGEVVGHRHRRLRRLRAARWSSAAGTSSRTARRRPTTATRTCGPTRSSRPRRRGSTAPRWPARPRPTRRWPSGATCCCEMARMSCEDGLVMTLHPGVRRDHHGPTFERFGADTGHDIPIRRRVHRRAAPAAGALRHPPGLPPRSCSPSTRPSGRASSHRWPGSTRRSTSACRGGSSTRPTRSGGSAPR